MALGAEGCVRILNGRRGDFSHGSSLACRGDCAERALLSARRREPRGGGAVQSDKRASKLVASDATGSMADQGNSVAVSADGNTAIVGGPCDSGGAQCRRRHRGGVGLPPAAAASGPNRRELVGTGEVGNIPC